MKQLLTALVLASATTLSYAQGIVTFNNNVIFNTTVSSSVVDGKGRDNGHADRLVYDTDNSTKLVGNAKYVAQLYYAPGVNQAASSLTTIAGDSASPFRVTTTGAPGTWNPGAGADKTFPNVAAGGSATLQVRVWDGSIFSTYALASANPSAVTGLSATFNYTVPSGNASPDAYYMEGLRSFTIGAVPEPSTIALGVLGAASLFVVRRRK